MKKKKKDPEAVMERAEKLFDRGNYLLAKQDFEKINRILKDDDIAEKIRICEKEITQLRVKDLVKKGRKNIKKNNLTEAIRCFEEAYELSGEDWLPERISELKADLFSRNSFEAAKEAEESGNYEKAADFYEQAYENQENEDLLLRSACSLVKAEKYDDAVSVFKNLKLSHQGAIYDYGFALAKIKKYYDCLRLWDSVKSNADEFLEQKRTVQSLLAEDICDRFSQLKTDSSQLATDSQNFKAIYEEGEYLIGNWKLETGNSKSETGLSDSHDQISGFKFQVSYCKYAWIDQLWRDEQYEKIGNMLLPYPPQMDSDLLVIYAKTLFRLAEISEKYLSDFTIFWLTHCTKSWRYSRN